MDDEAFYESVALELESDGPRKGLWAKAFAKTGGNDNAAKALYIELRVAELKQDAAHRTEEELQQRKRQAAADAKIEHQHQEEAAPWLDFAARMRSLGMSADLLRENLIDRGAKATVAERVVRQVFGGEKYKAANTSEDLATTHTDKAEMARPAHLDTKQSGSGPSGVGDWLFCLLRLSRGFCGFLFIMQIVGLLPVLSWLQQPDAVTGGMWAQVLIKALALALFGWLFFCLRSIINRLHTKKHGVPHPVLAQKKWAL